MIRWSSVTRFISLVLAMLLTACISLPPQQSPSDSRYAIKNDIGVLEPIDLASVIPVVPRLEPRTRAGNPNPYTINGVTYELIEDEAGFSETGLASWYGRKFHGHLTSNGEIYDMFQLSAAHTRLPIPSYIRVTNLDNGKSIVTRVNDRGPFHPGRVVDMSYAGAVMLGYADKGTARVRVEAIVPGQREPDPIVPEQIALPVTYPVSSIEEVVTERALIDSNIGQEFLQVGAFANENSARNLRSQLSEMSSFGVSIFSEAGANNTILHKVRIGPLNEGDNVDQLVQQIKAAQLGNPYKVRL